MRDQTGREIDYMRISITDRCNLRCKYCMPHGIQCMSRWEILSLEELEAIAVCAAGLGKKALDFLVANSGSRRNLEVDFFGGEPLMNWKVVKELVAYGRELEKQYDKHFRFTLTTNGVLLDSCMEQLLDAGLDGVNISLDTLDPGLYKKITGFDGLETVMKIIKKADTLPIPVKVNAVSIDFDRWSESPPTGRPGWLSIRPRL